MYSFGIKCYGLVLWLAQFFNAKAKSWVQGRRHFFERLPSFEGKKLYWFHCASLGEFDQGLPLINQLKDQDPTLFICVTFFSPSGFEHYHKRKHQADYVCYLPIDTKANAKKFIEHIKPEKVFFVKYEFWKNYLYYAKKSGANVYSVSALFRANQRFFHPLYGCIFQKVLQQFDYFFVQNEASKKLLQSIQLENVMVTGDTRFDRVIEHKEGLVEDTTIQHFLAGEKALILGSSWQEEELLMYNYVTQSQVKMPIIIAPHDISEKHISEIEKQWKDYCPIRYSNFNAAHKSQVLIIDCIGKLANVYQYGKYAFVGGGFSGSLHNILEPAVFKLPILIGPKYSRFPEAVDFVAERVVFPVESVESLKDQLVYIEKHEDEITNRLTQLISSSAGATSKIINYLNKLEIRS